MLISIVGPRYEYNVLSYVDVNSLFVPVGYNHSFGVLTIDVKMGTMMVVLEDLSASCFSP